MVFNFDNGTATTTLTVVENTNNTDNTTDNNTTTVASQADSQTSSNVKDDVPKTGDSTVDNMWYLLAILAGAGILVLEKKNYYKKENLK